MNKTILIIGMILSTTVIFSGCAEKVKYGISQNATIKSINEDALTGWWSPKWSEDGKDLNVTYNRGRNTMSISIRVSNSYNPFGVQTNGGEVKENVGEDVYGRELNITVATPSTWRGGPVKPDYIIGNGSIIYPVGANLEQSLFSRRFNVTINNEYDENGNLIGAYGKEEFSGHISTQTEKITYSGYAIGNFTEKDGQVVWTERIEKTNYYHNDKPYAETVTTVIPSSEYLGGKWVKTREDQKTVTTYADGSKRESELIIILRRNEYGVMAGMNGKGIVTGSDVINGKNINYSGSIVINYGLKSNIGWYKIVYNEKISGSGRLLKRLPFEAIYISDIYLRPVF